VPLHLFQLTPCSTLNAPQNHKTSKKKRTGPGHAAGPGSHDDNAEKEEGVEGTPETPLFAGWVTRARLNQKADRTGGGTGQGGKKRAAEGGPAKNKIAERQQGRGIIPSDPICGIPIAREESLLVPWLKSVLKE